MNTTVTRVVSLGIIGLFAAFPKAAEDALSQEQANAFVHKLDVIARSHDEAPGARRTSLSEGEVNSWLAYGAQAIVPAGIEGVILSLMEGGRVTGRAVVNLDRFPRKRVAPDSFDPWSYIRGKVPVLVKGILHTSEGVGTFDLESVTVANIVVPKFLLLESLTSYSRSADYPDGLNLDDHFDLPVNIRRIEVGPGQAVVVQ
jgi:hypothetical protein